MAGTDEARRPRALGWWTAAGAGGGVAGLALGGVLTGVAGWRAAFIVPAVLALACLPLVAALGPGQAADDRRPLDVGGALAAVGGLVLLLAGLSAIGQGGTGVPAWALLAGAAVALLAFVRIEARAKSPLLPRGWFVRSAAGGGTLASAVNTAATSPLAVLGALYLQDVRGWSPAANGLSFVPFSIMVIVGSMAGATLLRRLGAARTFALALVALVAMPLVSCAISADSGEVVLTVARAVDGLGLGIAAVVATSLGTSGAAAGRSWPGCGPHQHRRAARYRDERRVARAARLGGRRHGDRGAARVRDQRGDRGRGRRVDARAAAAVGLASLEPLRLEPRAHVDVELAQRARRPS